LAAIAARDDWAAARIVTFSWLVIVARFVVVGLLKQVATV